MSSAATYRILVGAATCALMLACGEDDGAPMDAGLSCTEACSQRSSSCAIPAVLSTPGCRDLCGRNPTDDQVSCIAAARCPELEGAFDDGMVCGILVTEDAGAMTDTGLTACAPIGQACSVTDGPMCCVDRSIPRCDAETNRCCLPEGSECEEDAACCGRLTCRVVPGNTQARCSRDRN